MGSSILFVTHDMAVHANMADRLGIMYAGRLVEEGPTREIFREPLHPYTAPSDREPAADRRRRAASRALEGAPPNLADPPPGCRFHPRCPLAIDSLPRAEPAAGRRSAPDRRVACFAVTPEEPASDERRLLEVDAVTKTYAHGRLLSRASDSTRSTSVSFALEAGRPEIFTDHRRIRQRQDHAGPHDPQPGAADRGRASASTASTSRPIRSRPRAAGLHAAGAADLPEPVRGVQSAEARRPLSVHDRAPLHRRPHDRPRSRPSADRALRQVGLSLAEVKGRFPHELSGGQLQRVAIARALISGPSLIVADEPVSMVDASLRMAIVNLFKTLRDDLKVSIIYITHDLATAYYISDRIIIMQKGKVVESGDARAVLDSPQHPYSILLKNSVLSARCPPAGATLDHRRASRSTSP